MVFQFHDRKLMAELCEQICHGKNSLSNCSSPKDCTLCFNICLTNPQLPPFYYPPPPPSPKIQTSIFSSDENENQHKITNYFILTLTLLAFIFFVICIRSIYINFRSRRRRRRLSAISPPPSSSLSSIPIQQFDDNDDHDDGMVDHPIWYIRTLGLHQSVINAISVCKYKKGEGLIEGTECSVCLSEFEEDENLRLLPKCHHAFHLPCIDTWLNSHTNCPMCRAPIVNNPIATRVESLESRVVDSHSSSWGDTRIDISDGIIGESETNLGFESSVFDSGSMNREENEEGRLEVSENERRVVDVNAVSVRPRRSVSMDDSFVAKYNHALANVLSIESNGNGIGNGNSSGMSLNEHAISKVNGNENLATTSKGSSSSSFRLPRYLQGVPSPMKRSSSYNGKFLLSWYSRSMRKPNGISRRF